MEVKIHPKVTTPIARPQHTNNLPRLLHTPTGLALLEIQGTINLPDHFTSDPDSYGSSSTGTHPNDSSAQDLQIGRLVFPDYDPENPSSTAWMKRVYLYVGRHQRMTGEVKKLPKAVAVLRKKVVAGVATSARVVVSEDVDTDLEEAVKPEEELEIVEIVKWKILFSTRPEPVGTYTG